MLALGSARSGAPTSQSPGGLSEVLLAVPGAVSVVDLVGLDEFDRDPNKLPVLVYLPEDWEGAISAEGREQDDWLAGQI